MFVSGCLSLSGYEMLLRVLALVLGWFLEGKELGWSYFTPDVPWSMVRRCPYSTWVVCLNRGYRNCERNQKVAFRTCREFLRREKLNGWLFFFFVEHLMNVWGVRNVLFLFHLYCGCIYLSLCTFYIPSLCSHEVVAFPFMFIYASPCLYFQTIVYF